MAVPKEAMQDVWQGVLGAAAAFDVKLGIEKFWMEGGRWQRMGPTLSAAERPDTTDPKVRYRMFANGGMIKWVDGQGGFEL